MNPKRQTSPCVSSRLRTHCISVICPQCFYQYDTGQAIAARKLRLDYRLPVFYYLQLLALATGYCIDDVYYSKHRVKDVGLGAKLEEILA